MKFHKQNPFIVGGTGRVGKSLLLKKISENKDLDYSLLQEDAKINKNLSKRHINNIKEEKEFLIKYLSTSRFIDKDNKHTKKLIDNFNFSVGEFIKKVKKKSYPISPISSIFSCFDLLAKETNKNSWGVCDIHSEFYYEKYKKVCKNLKILILNRDPIEAICAHLYWRTYPIALNDYKRNFWYALTFWLITRRIGKSLKKKYENDVYLISINDLIENKNYLKDNFNIKNLNFPKKIFFCFDHKKKLFYTYDKKWKKLLTEIEIEIIYLFRDSKFQNKNLKWLIYKKYFFHIILIKFLVNISILNPHCMLYFITYILFPKNFFIFIKEYAKKIFKKRLFT